MTTPRPRFPFEDSTLPVDQRVDDLLSRMQPEDKAGLMFHPLAMFDIDGPGMMGTPSTREILDRRITHFNVLGAASARELAEWNNTVQQIARRHPLRIPATISSDPRHSFTDNPAAALMAGPFSQWPEPLGFGAIGSEELVERWARVVRREYLAVGIRVALHPQIDLATEPRWGRQSGTFGEDARLTARLGAAYIRGLQGEGVAHDTISAVAKHFPGGGPQKDGEDPHFAYGREQVYPGGRFDLHLEPFKAAIAAGVSQMMPYYGMPIAEGMEPVGFGFNRAIITDLLRGELGFDGIVCTDWGILSGMYWGVEELSYEQRMLKALDAGVDQFGGEWRTHVLVELIRNGEVEAARIDRSVRRLLREKFLLGLFDDPFVDPDHAEIVINAEDAREEGIAAQAAALTVLANGQGTATLPLAKGLRVYVEGIEPSALDGRARVVPTPDEADLAILRMPAPWEAKDDADNPIASFFHTGSLAFPDNEIERIAAIRSTVPTVIGVSLDRPAILAPFVDDATTLVADFGAGAEAFVRGVFGELPMRGRLPFDIPSSMAAVDKSRSDVPFDTANPTFRFGFGLSI